MKLKHNLTEWPILKSLITLALPIMFANILQTAYQLIDTFWIWRLWTDAVAAVSISFPMIFLIVSLWTGLAMAWTILIWQYKGKKDQQSVNHIATQTMVVVVIISIILALIGYLLSPLLIKLMWAESSVYKDAVSYMKISFIWMIFMFTYMVFQSLMRWVWEVKIPVFIVLGTVLLNLVFDPLFIFWYWFIPAYWVAWAAVATIATQAIAAIIGIAILVKWQYWIKTDLSDLKLDIPLIKKMLKIWVPASLENSTRALWMTAMVFLVTTFWTQTVAVYGIWWRILSFIIIPGLWLSMATSTMVAQNVWAKKLDRVKETVKLSAMIGAIFLTLVWVLVFIFAEQIAAVFIPWETETIKSSAHFIRVMSPTFGFIWIQMALMWALRWTWNTFISMILSIIYLWGLRFPLAYILSMFTSLKETGIWIAFPISNVLAVIIVSIWFINWKRKEKKLIEEKGIDEVVEEGIIEEA